MAIPITAVWEFRATTGANTNGGFYKSDAGTTDYSQQASPQWTGTNISSDGAGTAITDDDAQGLFTAQMVGNGKYITGGDGFTTGWYLIVAFTDSNNIVIDRSAGASKSGGTGNVGGALAVYLDAVADTRVAGNILYFDNSGTYTITGTINPSSPGTTANHIRYIGYDGTRGNTPTGTGRPLWSFGANKLNVYPYEVFYNIRITGSGTSEVIAVVGSESLAVNCKFDNTHATTLSKLIKGQASMHLLGCEVDANGNTSTTGSLISLETDRHIIKDCYLHGLPNGSGITTFGGVDDVDVEFNVFDGFADDGLRIDGIRYDVINNTFYNCNNGVRVATASRTAVKIINNDFNSCTLGIDAPDTTADRFIAFNNFYNNTADVSANTPNYFPTAVDPAYAGAGSGDFSNSLEADANMPTPGLNIKAGAAQNADGNGGSSNYGPLTKGGDMLGEKQRSETFRIHLWGLSAAPTGTPQIEIGKQGAEILAATNMTVKAGTGNLVWYYDHTVAADADVGAYQVQCSAVISGATVYGFDHFDVNIYTTDEGARAIVINVKDGDTNPVEGVKISIHNSANNDTPIFGQILVTDGLGNTDTIYLNDATYTVRLSEGNIVSEDETIVVSASATKNLTVVLNAISEPGDPDLCRLYIYPITLGNADVTDLASSFTISSTEALTKVNGEFIRHAELPFVYDSGTSPDSYYFDAVQGTLVNIKCDVLGIDHEITVPATATADLDTLIS